MFEQYPDKYISWWGIKTLPCVNELNADYMNYIIYDEDKDKEGVYFIQLRDKDYNVLCTIGDFME